MVTVTQFKLRNLFGAITWIALVLASVRISPFAVLYFGVPLGCLACRVVTDGPATVVRIMRSANSSPFRIVALGTLFILMGVIVGLGWRPYNAATGLFLVGTIIWQLILNVALKTTPRNKLVQTVPLWAAAYPAFWLTCGREDMPSFLPGGGWYSVDFATDRHRIELWPDLDFWRPGRNHALLKPHSIGAAEHWIFKAVMGHGHILGGGDRVDTKSVLVRPTLPLILRMLPSDAARHQVIASLADRENLARVHQGLLLTCVALTLQTRSGSLDDWWDSHRKWFVSLPDPQGAAELALQIKKDIDRYVDDTTYKMSLEMKDEINVQLRAARWHELGFYDEAFAAGILKRTRLDVADGGGQ